MRKASWEAFLLPPESVDSLTIYGNSRNGAITCAEARALGIAPVQRDYPICDYMRDSDRDWGVRGE